MKRKVWIWIIGVLLVIGVIENIFGGSAKTAEQASAPAPTVAAQPTGLPAPTAALATLVPTVSPLPTATSKPQASPQMQAYVQALLPDIQLAGNGLTRVGELSTEASQTPALMTDKNWRGQMGIALASLKMVGHDFQQKRDVPAKAASVDTLIVSMGDDLNYIADEMATGFDTFQSSHIQNATARMAQVSSKAKQATAEIKRLTSQ